jgi:hypothetical protein
MLEAHDPVTSFHTLGEQPSLDLSQDLGAAGSSRAQPLAGSSGVSDCSGPISLRQHESLGQFKVRLEFTRLNTLLSVDDVNSTLEHRDGVAGFTLLDQESPKVAQERGHTRMFRAECLLADRQRARVQLLGLLVFFNVRVGVR